MSRPPAPLPPLTIGSLARTLLAQAGQPVPALRCYESLAALWVHCCDAGLPAAPTLREHTEHAAQQLTAGRDTVLAPAHGTVPIRLAAQESIVRLPASLAVQGVEWTDLVTLAQQWLDTRGVDGPVLVLGVRTGGAYLAPLVAAHLAAAGLDVQLSSVRAGEQHPTGDRRVLLVDDPPLTGRTLVDQAREASGPGGLEVLVPVFNVGDVRPLREAGIPVTVLTRDKWASTRRLEPAALSAYLDAHTTSPCRVEGFEPGRENSALCPWPGVRRRSPARAAVHLLTTAGPRRAVAGWVAPGIFGDAARAVARGLDTPVPPATLAVTPALVVSEDLTPACALGHGDKQRVPEAVEYVLTRARQLPLTPVSGPIPAVLRSLATALTGSPNEAVAARLHQLVARLGPALPDNRCQAEKWLIDDEGRLRKTGHLTHAYRRDNELFTPLIDLAALTVTFDCSLPALAELLDQRLSHHSPWLPSLAAALLCYGTARGAQIPRTYTPQRAAEIAGEARLLQRNMVDAARLLLDANVASASSTVVHRWSRPPAALVQPLLPFGQATTDTAPSTPTVETEKAVTHWAGDLFLPVRAGNELLLAPLVPPASWPRAAAALEDLAKRLPHPDLLTWCGLPIVSLEAP